MTANEQGPFQAPKLVKAFLWAILLVATPFKAWGLSEIVNGLDPWPGFNATYGQSYSCTSCHDGSPGNLHNWAQQFRNAMNANPTTSGASALTLSGSQIEDFARQIENAFVPRLDTLQAIDANGLATGSGMTSPGTSGWSVTLPGDTDELSLTFDSPLNPVTTSTTTITAINATASVPGISTSKVSDTNYVLNAPPLKDRSAIRSAGGYQISFAPVAGSGLTCRLNGAGSTCETLTVTFTNLVPLAANLSVGDLVNTETSRVIPVIGPAADDPDGANTNLALDDIQGQSISVLSGTLTDTGSFATSPDGQSVIYTLPATLPDAGATIAVSYTVRDPEGASASATLEVDVPAAPPNQVPVAGDDAFAISEGGDLTNQSVAQNDSDAETATDQLVFALTAPIPSNAGTLSFRPDGTFDYATPDDDFNGQVSFQYQITDQRGAVDGASVTLTVEPVNDAPVAQAAAFSPRRIDADQDPNTAGTQSEFALLDFVSDVDNADSDLTLQITQGLATDGTQGTLYLNAAGTAAFYELPATLPFVTSTATFQYVAQDNAAGTSAPATVTINLPAAVPTSAPPFAQNDDFQIAEDSGVLTGNVSADNGNGADTDADTAAANLVFTLVGAIATEAGVLDFQSTGDFEFTPQVNFNGTASFSYQVEDPEGNTDQASVTVSVTPVNDVPVALDVAFAIAEDDPDDNSAVPGVQHRLDLLAGAFDVESPPASLTVVLLDTLAPGDGTLSLAGGDTFVEYTLPAQLPDTAQIVTIRYRAVDPDGGQSEIATLSLTIPPAIVTQQPPLAEDDLFVLDEDTSLTDGDVTLANGGNADSDPDTDAANWVFRLVQDVSDGTLDFRTDGTFDFTPNPDQDSDQTFVYELSDGSLTSKATATIQITPINDLPRVSAIVVEDRSDKATGFTLDLVDPDWDPDGDRLTIEDVSFALVDRSGNPVPRQSGFFTRSGTQVTFEPSLYELVLDNDEFALVTVDYFVTDGSGDGRVPNSLTFEIVGTDNVVNKSPGAYADTLSGRYVSDALGNHFPGANDTGACLACHISNATTDADVDSRAECGPDSGPGQIFTQYGLDICLDRADDDPGFTRLPERLANQEAKYAPRLIYDGTILSVTETAVAGTAIGAPMTADPGLTVMAVQSQIVTYLLSDNGQTLNPTDPSGQFQINDAGQISVAGALQPGVHEILVIPVNDAGQRDQNENPKQGPGFFPTVQIASSVVTIEVVAERPVAVSDAVNVEAGVSATLALTDNDTGGDPTSLSIVSAPTNGVAVVNADLSVSYTADAAFAGTDSFDYTVTNAVGTSTPATVAITVVAAGEVIAMDDNVVTTPGQPVTVAVLDNDTNVSAATQIAIVNPPDPTSEGVAQVVNQGIRFTPAAGVSSGTITFAYRAQNDPATAGSQASVSVSIIQVGSGTISAAVTDPELRKVAVAFEETCAIVDPSGGTDTAQFLNVCGALAQEAAQALNASSTSSAALDAAMRAMRNEEHLASVDATMSVARSLGSVVQTRISRLRAGPARGLDAEGLSFQFDGQSLPTQLLSDAANGLIHGVAQGPQGFAARPNWGMFISGEFSLVDVSSSPNQESFELQQNDLMIGYDHWLSAESVIGVALGYANSSTDFSDTGSLDGDGFELSVYGLQKNIFAPGVSLGGYASVGRMNYDMKRPIQFNAGGVTVNDTADSSFDGTYVNLVPRLAYTQQLGASDTDDTSQPATSLTWFVGLDYLWSDIGAYVESGSSGLELSTESGSYQSLIVDIGAEASRPIRLGPGTRAEIFGSLSLRGELLDKDRSVRSSFAVAGGQGPSFVVTEEGTHGIGGRLELGTVIGLGNGGEFLARYRLDQASDRVTAQSLAIGFGKTFANGGTLSLGTSGEFATQGYGLGTTTIDYSLRF